MYHNRRLVKKINKFYNLLSKKILFAIKKQIVWLLRTLFVPKRRQATVNAGFILPTVAMVSLVVVLLTTAILFRSFDRSKNASNVRVNEAVISAAAPALERAKSKINKLLQDPRLPRSTPSDLSLYQTITDNINQFTLGDETQLKLVYDINGDSIINSSPTTLDQNETLTTAWKYPVDTNNDGKFDSYTLYGIYFRSPISDRSRSPLEARTPPMNENDKGSECDAGATTSAQLVGSNGWFKRGGTLKKSIFVYTTTIPITDTTGLNTTDSTKKMYQNFTGNKGFAALEYQQDRERIAITNNAVVYNDDLQISPGGGLFLNGRISTNANLLTGQTSDAIQLFLVSSPHSCYYNAANSKIVVGGNVANGRVTDSGSDINSSLGVRVDFFKQAGPGSSDKDYINSTNKTVTNFGSKVAYNSGAYEMRIKLLVDAAVSATLPTEVTTAVTQQTSADATLDATTVQRKQLGIYFRKRTRRVPYAEVPFGQETSLALKNTSTDYTTSNVLQGSGDTLRPPDKWIYPYAFSDGITETGYSNLPIKINSDDHTKIYLPASATTFPEPQGDEAKIGDRVVVGNNLPEMWWNGTKFVSQQDGQDGGQTIGDSTNLKTWDVGSGNRLRFPQTKQLDDLGVTDRDDFWEKNAAEKAQGILDVVGGLRVITGAGIYLPNNYTPTSSATDFTTALTTTNKVWSDSMAVASTMTDGLPSDKTPFLQMRATAVYHYTQSSFNPTTSSTNPQTPIACVSSFYDPTSSTTARNKAGLPDVSRLTDTTGTVTTNPGNSNNGVVYDPPSKTKSDYIDALNYQAALKYPNGQLVNERLNAALAQGSGNLTLSERSALDSAICALELLDSNVTKTPKATVIPHGAIREIAFLDARQIKAIDRPGNSNSTTYNLDVELRQPLEIRATVLDLNLLRGKSIGTGEFLLPNSGIIYATRDDALPDQSNTTSLDLSATDFMLDPTRRPNGIMLINGSDISRNATYKPEEKGLILATNLPIYIKGDFNKHSQQEFDNTTYSENLASDWSNFYTRAHLNKQFACRKGQFTACSIGETWRPATVIADAITILSSNFREGFRNEGDYNLRDNVAPLGYDYDADGTIGTNAVSIDERTVQYDLDGDGNTTTTSYSITEQNIPSVVAHRLNGFWDNNFVTSLPWNDDGSGNLTDSSNNPIKSSYFNNFVTPVQRRTSFPEYVMEICRKVTISACKPSDWSVGYGTIGAVDWSYKATNSGTNRILPNDSSYTVNKLGAGTTDRPALNPTDQGYPRRVAFLRDTTGNLILDSSNKPIPLGVQGADIIPSSSQSDKDSGQVYYYPYNSITIGSDTYNPYSSTHKPRLNTNTLWFQTNNSLTGYNFPLSIKNSAGLTSTRNTDQPLLIPALQIQYPYSGPSDTSWSSNTQNIKDQNQSNGWLQRVNDGTTTITAETNLAFVQGDTPGRPSETNGGLENFVRYLENWQNANGTSQNHKIAGAFIQYKRSSYATAPWSTLTNTYNSTTTNFGYPYGYRITVNNDGGVTFGRTAFFIQPIRGWGFDVALLTQLPDLFSQRFTSPSAGDPNEFYREVGRDDLWVQTLLCAAQPSNYDGNFGTAPAKYGTDFNSASFKYAISNDQRPTSCRN